MLFILRWFWHRINPYSEIAAMGISFTVALAFFINDKMEHPFFAMASHWRLVTGVVVTTLGWVLTSFLTRPADATTSADCNRLIFDGASKFRHFGSKTVAFLCGVAGVYAALFGIGHFIYGNYTTAMLLTAVVCICTGVLLRTRKRWLA